VISIRIASCGCGGLTAVCQGEPVRVSVCHCLACQQRTGSAFGVQARYEADRVAVRGVSGQYVRVGDAGTRTAFSFCPVCATTLLWRSDEAPDVVAVAVGAFADPGFPAPVRAVYEERAHPWLTLTGEIERDW
jgi:hypothetical protein